MHVEPATVAPGPAPVAPGERILALDVLRGFALLGILIANMPSFGQPADAGRAGIELFPAWYDRAADWLAGFLVQGKLNAIFSFLFGVGFTVLMDRAEARGGGGPALYLRRVLVLFLLGAAHYALLWDGDILHSYAILGLFLPLVRRLRLPDAALIAVAFLLLTAELGHRYATQYFGLIPSPTRSESAARAAEQLRLYGGGDYPAQVAHRLVEFWRTHVRKGTDWWGLCTYGGTMLLGFVAGRRGLFRDVDRHAAFFRRLMVVGLVLGLAFAAVYATGIRRIDRTAVTPGRVLVGLAFILNRLFLSAAYVAGLTLLCRRGPWAVRLGPLAATGRMPLTNYILQSLVCTTIFYGYGLGLYGGVGPLACTVLALAIYASQVAFSSWWMRRFLFGPLEWVWRALSYGRAPAWRAGPRGGVGAGRDRSPPGPSGPAVGVSRPDPVRQ